MRWVAAERISRATDESTSITRQRAAILAAVAAEGGEIIGHATDEDVSATKVRPQDRAGLGPWVTSTPPEEFDGIVWARLDRAVRSMTDMYWLANWAAEHGKVLLFATGPNGQSLRLDFRKGLDLVTSLILQILSFTAQMESQNIKERVTDSHAYLKSVGRWTGGMPLYGYRPVRAGGAKDGWKLVVDDAATSVILGVVAELLDSDTPRSIEDICESLTQQHIPSPSDRARQISADLKGEEGKLRGSKWHPTTVRQLLRNRGLVGETTLNGRTVRDSTGLPLPRQGVLTVERFDELQKKLDDLSTGSVPVRKDANPLLGVAKCPTHNNLRLKEYTRGSHTYRYVFCAVKGCDTSVSLDVLQDAVSRAVSDTFGSLETYARVYHAGTDNSEARARVESALKGLRAENDAGLERYSEDSYPQMR